MSSDGNDEVPPVDETTAASGGQSAKSEDYKVIAKMISRRAGKKRCIIMRRKTINDIISQRGSRTKILILLKELMRVYSAAEERHVRVLELLDPDDPRYSHHLRLTSVSMLAWVGRSFILMAFFHASLSWARHG